MNQIEDINKKDTKNLSENLFLVAHRQDGFEAHCKT